MESIGGRRCASAESTGDWQTDVTQQRDATEPRDLLRETTARSQSAPRDGRSDQDYEALLAEVAIAEQARIGRDLHDTVGQELAALALSAERASRGAVCRPAAETLAELAAGIRSALAGLRAATHGLTRVADDAQSLVLALEALANSVREHRAIACRLETRAEEAIPDDVAEHLYRIASEAVANAVHHARPTCIDIQLTPEEGRLTLRVTDDGVGMPVRRTNGGIGTWIMRSRAAAIQAEFEIRGGEPCGTVVTCRLAGASHGTV
jgi:signal transduction histidine kinase